MNNAAKDNVNFWNNYGQPHVVSKVLIEKFKDLATTGCRGEIITSQQKELPLNQNNISTIALFPNIYSSNEWLNNTLQILTFINHNITYEIFSINSEIQICISTEMKNVKVLQSMISKFVDCEILNRDPLEDLILSKNFSCEHYYPIPPFYRNLISSTDKNTSTIYQLLNGTKGDFYYRVNISPANEDWIEQSFNAFEYESKVKKINPDLNFQGYWYTPPQQIASKGLLEKIRPENLPLYFASPSITSFGNKNVPAKTFIKQLTYGDRNYRVKSDIFSELTIEEYQSRLINRENIVEGHLLNKLELSYLASLPCEKCIENKSINLNKNTHLQPSKEFTQKGIIIGAVNNNTQNKKVSIPEKMMENSIGILGNQGFGKSTLLLNIIEQMHQEKQAIIVFYFHEIDFFKNLISNIPENRLNDVIFASPSYNDHLLARNFVDSSNYSDSIEAASDLCDAIITGANSKGINIEYNLRNIFTILLQNKNTCMSDYIEIIDKNSREGNKLRNTSIEKIKSPHLIQFINSLNQKGIDTSAIHNKFQHLFSTENLCNWMGYKGENRLNYKDVVENKKILLYYLGGLSNAGPVIASIELANLYHHFLSYSNLENTPFNKTTVIIDEAQKICCSSYSKSVKENRKYGERFIISTQTMQGVDSALKEGIDLTGTLMLFNSPESDMKYFCEKSGKIIYPKDLTKLEKYEIFVRAMSANNVFSCNTLPYKARENENFNYVIENSLRNYYIPPTQEKKKENIRSSILTKLLNQSKGVSNE